MKKYTLSVIITAVILIVAQLFIHTSMTISSNFCFFWGLISLTLGACCYIWQTGFLDLFFEGFKKFGTMIMPPSRSLERTNKQLKEDEALNIWKRSIFRNAKLFLLGIGTGMTLFSVVVVV